LRRESVVGSSLGHRREDLMDDAANSSSQPCPLCYMKQTPGTDSRQEIV
jgi:hypothetical protein